MSTSGCWPDAHLRLSEYSRLVFGYAGNAWVRVVGSGVNTTRFAPHRSGTRDGGARFVGIPLPQKGVGDLLKRLPPDIRFVGPRPDAETKARLAAWARNNDHALVEAHGRAFCIVLPSVSRSRVGDHRRQACAMEEAARRRILSHFTWPALVSRRREAHRANTLERAA